MTIPTPPASPCTARARMSISMLGLTAHISDVTTYAISPTRRGMRRPNRSDRGPAISCPRASPMRHAVIVSCATDVAASNPSVREGSTGRYRSIEIGPKTVNRRSSVGTNLPTAGRVEVSDVSGMTPTQPFHTRVREFLMSRRAKLTPEAAGLPTGPNRRVTGLRRTEAATLAGVSVEYYAKLE